MSRRNKLQKFAEILSFPNVYENYDPKDPGLVGQDGEPVEMKGVWAEKHFKNDNPITLELACGRGEYTLGLSERFPSRNFIGLDVKGARIWKGSSIAIEKKLNNAAFLRTRIEQIGLFFDENEISEIWITFPDPFLRKGKENRRLTSPYFINQYRKVLHPNGTINLKTDSEELYEFTLETIGNDKKCKLIYHDDDIYSKDLVTEELEIKTYYEKMHLEAKKTIKYVKFTI